MSIKPPIKCPPDYSILAFRITECKKAGIVKGIETQLSVDLQKLFVPVTNYEERSMVLKAGETKKIDVSNIGVRWPLKETYTFVANQNYCGDGTDHRYTLYDKDLNLIDTISWTVNINVPAIDTFEKALNLALSGSPQIIQNVGISASAFSTSGIITATANTAETKYRHVFEFDLTGFGGYNPFPYKHPGNLTVPYVKYERPRVKIMLIYPDFYKASALVNCGCIDPSGDLMSNKKYIEYAYDDDYYRINNPGSPITISPVVNANATGTAWTWDQSSPDHIGYHFNINDLVNAGGDITKRGLINQLQGYFFSTDSLIGVNTPGISISHTYSPNAVQWRKMGDFYLHTTAQDINDGDKLYIETLWLRNPHGYDLPIKIMLAS
jgi:hypothetical protein